MVVGQQSTTTGASAEDLPYLIGTGFALGVVHVLTGPDHLSALATLSANINHHFEAAILGIRWGIGHSSGLLLVGTILIVMSEKGQDSVTMPDYASHFFESIVGVFMLLLGMYGIRRAWLKRPTSYYDAIGGVDASNSSGDNSDHDDDDDDDDIEAVPPSSKQKCQKGGDGIFRLDASDEDFFYQEEQKDEVQTNKQLERTRSHDSSNGDKNQKQKQQQRRRPTLELYLDGDETPVCIPPPVSEQSMVSSSQGAATSEDALMTTDHQHGGIVTVLTDGSDFEEAVVIEQEYLHSVSPLKFRRSFQTITKRLSAKTLAFLIGVVHGLAGPGGVLGVIPAVQLQNWKLATIYLSCFCISSTITMGCFATLYGKCTSKISGSDSSVAANQKRQFHIECFSACLSILVGITWLTLLSLGKLEDVFP